MNREDDNENNTTENTVKIVSMGSEIGHLTKMTGKKPKVNLRNLLKLKRMKDLLKHEATNERIELGYERLTR